MANPFTMMNMLGRARRAAAKRTASTTSVSDETASLATLSTATTVSAASTLVNPTPKDTSDTASIKSSRFKASVRKATLLSRMSSSVVPTTTPPRTSSDTLPERPSTPANELTTIVSDSPQATLSESPKLQALDLKNMSSEALSTVIIEEQKPKVLVEEGDKSTLHDAPIPKVPMPLEAVEAKQTVETAVDNGVDKELVKRLEEAKAKLEAENTKLVQEVQAKEERWKTERQSEKLARAAENTKQLRVLKEKTEQWNSELQAQKAAFEAEKEKLLEEMKEKTKQAEKDREAERKSLDAERGLVERDNEQLTSQVAVLESTLEQRRASVAHLEELLAGMRQQREETLNDIQDLQHVVETTMGDVRKLQQKEHIHQQTEIALRDEIARIRKERDANLAVRDDHIESLNAKLTESRSQLEDFREAAERKNLEKDKAIEELRDQMTAYYHYVDETERRNRLLSDQLKRQAMDVRFVKPSETRRLLKAATEPVDAAVRVLQNFNSEVFQTAASFADSVDVDTTGDTSEPADIEALVVKLAPIMSRDLVHTLRSAYMDASEESNPLLLQIALQACMTHCANRFINAWYPFQWEQGDLLQILYGRILYTGKNETAETWRTTTKALLRLTSEAHPQLLAYFKEYVYDILAVVGRPRSQPAVEALIKEYHEKLSMITRLAIRLHILFNDILVNDTPCNLAACISQPDGEFLREQLEDNYPEGGDSSTDLLSDNRIICTAELGLQKISGVEEANYILVKPKVVLATILSQDW